MIPVFEDVIDIALSTDEDFQDKLMYINDDRLAEYEQEMNEYYNQIDPMDCMLSEEADLLNSDVDQDIIDDIEMEDDDVGELIDIVMEN